MLLPYRETLEMDFYASLTNPGEYLAFFKSPINGWCPMIAVWPEPAADTVEDTITVLGKQLAFCISGDGAADFGGSITKIAMSQVPHQHLFAIGALMRRVI